MVTQTSQLELQAKAWGDGTVGTSNIWSERRDSNPRPSPWQGDVLPLNYSRTTFNT